MRKPLICLLIISAVSVLAGSGCGRPSDGNEPVSPETPEYSILGTWAYELLIEGDSGSYDSGTITFKGSDAAGNYVQVDFYDIEYVGDYIVRGVSVEITGPQEWAGSFTDATHMSGSWESLDDAHTGTWTATKQ